MTHELNREEVTSRRLAALNKDDFRSLQTKIEGAQLEGGPQKTGPTLHYSSGDLNLSTKGRSISHSNLRPLLLTQSRSEIDMQAVYQLPHAVLFFCSLNNCPDSRLPTSAPACCRSAVYRHRRHFSALVTIQACSRRLSGQVSYCSSVLLILQDTPQSCATLELCLYPLSRSDCVSIRHIPGSK